MNTDNTVHRIQNTTLCMIASCFMLFSHPSMAGFISHGKGNVSDTINPKGYKCSQDHGYWIGNAGVVSPGVSSCNPIGTPTPIYPQTVGEAAQKPTATHRWWGALSFYGEMKIGDASKPAYITPDPITARISEKGVRLLGIPAGLKTTNEINSTYTIPAPLDEVFDGIAVGNTNFQNMEGYLKDFSDGTATAQWKQNGQVIMEATFVHGSPYVYFSVFKGQLVLRSRGANGNEKGLFYQANNSLGVWTKVATIAATFSSRGKEPQLTPIPTAGKSQLTMLRVKSLLRFYHYKADGSHHPIRCLRHTEQMQKSIRMKMRLLDLTHFRDGHSHA